jgi:hypothetical protein
MSYLLGGLSANYTLSGPASALTAALYTNSAGTLGTLLTQFTASSSHGFTPLSPDVLLAPNTSYWFALGLNPGQLSSPSVARLDWSYENTNDATGPGTVGASRGEGPNGTSSWPAQSLQIEVNGILAGGDPVPEIDPGATCGGLTLLVGGLLILTGRRAPAAA